MLIDITKEEWEFLERMVKRAVVLTEMQDDDFQPIRDVDHHKAKRLLDKFIIGRR